MTTPPPGYQTEYSFGGVANAGAVDAASLFAAVREFVRRYVVLSDEQALAVALWVFHTWAFDGAHSTPYLHVTSAVRRSGKSRLLEVLSVLVRNPLSTGGATEAAIFRSISKEPKPTLLMDEVDGVLGGRRDDRSKDLAALLNNGYRAGSPILRCVGEKSEVERFDVFCAKALSGIGSLKPDTLADRTLPIRLQRRTRDEGIERFRERRAHAEAEPIRNQLAAWAIAHVDALHDAEPELPEELDDRAQDVLEPLIAIAETLHVGVDARKALVALRGLAVHEHNEDVGIQLLADVRRAFDDSGEDRLSSKDLLAALVTFEESPWATWHRGSWMTPKALAALLHDHSIRSRTIRLDDGSTPKGYKREQFEDAWKRLLSPDGSEDTHFPATTPQPARLSEKQADSSRHTDFPVAPQNGDKAWSEAACGGVAANGASGAPLNGERANRLMLNAGPTVNSNYRRPRWDATKQDFFFDGGESV